MANHYDVIVIGAGAAGLMCALTAGQRGRRVVLLEHSGEVGRKILISGGGRCNFTNLHTTPANFLSANPHFCKSALARYTPADFIGLVERHGISYHEKKLGQLFCDRSARDIVDLLVQESRDAGVKIQTGVFITGVSRADRFEVETTSGNLLADAVVVASGGLSIPKIGATHLGYRLAKRFGHRMEPTRPALVPLTLGAPDNRLTEGLSGVAAEVDAYSDGQSFREKMLITHRGLSGPAILQISSYWQPGGELSLDLLPGIDLAAHARERPQASVRTLVSEHLPRRLAERWLEGEPKPDLGRLEQRLHRWSIRPDGTEGFAKAEVTAGGVDTRELSSKTMESRLVPGLYFVGEVMDVTGHLGGFNFQWAWASGYAAGQSA